MRQKKNSFLFPLVCMLCLLGCSTTSYIRSDVFLDSKAVQSIYLMPIAPEIKIDSETEITGDELKRGINEALENLKSTIVQEFFKRGYSVAVYNKNFSELDEKEGSEKSVQEAVLEFVKGTGDQSNLEGKLIGKILDSIFINTDAKEKDSHIQFKGNMNTDDFSNDPKEREEDRKINPLVERTKSLQGIIPEGTDTVLFVEVESFIAKRGIFNSVKENSWIAVTFTMISLEKEEIIFSDRSFQNKSDILRGGSILNVLKGIFRKVPIKL